MTGQGAIAPCFFVCREVIAVGFGAGYELITEGSLPRVKGGTHLPPIFDLIVCIGLVFGGGYGVYAYWPWRKRPEDD